MGFSATRPVPQGPGFLLFGAYLGRAISLGAALR